MSSCASCLILGPSEYHRRLAAPEGASSSSHLVRRASFSFSEILIGVFSSDRAASLTKDRSGRILNTELLRGGLEPNVISPLITAEMCKEHYLYKHLHDGDQVSIDWDDVFEFVHQLTDVQDFFDQPHQSQNTNTFDEAQCSAIVTAPHYRFGDGLKGQSGEEVDGKPASQIVSYN